MRPGQVGFLLEELLGMLVLVVGLDNRFIHGVDYSIWEDGRAGLDGISRTGGLADSEDDLIRA